MNKKILFGSIIAVSLLTLVSFSNVVGYQSVKSDSKLKSPLFNVRTNKATDEEDYNIQCDFVGKGKDVFIFQKNHRMAGIINDLIADINNMDEEEFLDTIQKVKNRFPNKDSLEVYQKDELINYLNSIKDNPVVLNKFQKYLTNIYKNDKSLETIDFKDCFYYILTSIILLIVTMFIFLLSIFLTIFICWVFERWLETMGCTFHYTCSMCLGVSTD